MILLLLMELFFFFFFLPIIFPDGFGLLSIFIISTCHNGCKRRSEAPIHQTTNLAAQTAHLANHNQL